MDSDENLPISIPLLPLKEFLACPICMCEFDKTYMTPCGHRYCEKCIRECVNRRHKCPCCNARVQDSQLIKDAGFDGLIAMVNQEKGKAEDGYFNILIKNAAQITDTSQAGDAVQREISPIEDVLQKHLKNGLASFELYYRNLRKDFEQRIKEAETALEVALADLQVSSSMDNVASNTAQDIAATKQVQECEDRRQHLERELEACTKLLVESYDRHLSEHVPAPSLLPVNISIVLHGKPVTLKEVKLKPHDSLSRIKEIVFERMEKLGDPVAIYPDDEVKYILVGPFAKDNGTLPLEAIERVACGEMAQDNAEQDGNSTEGAGRLDDITLLPTGCHPVLEYAIKPASVIVLLGSIKLQSEMPKRCFVKTFKEGDTEKVDYYTCKQCKFNWVCKSCKEFCHKDHHTVPYVMGHTPTWACCHCPRKKKCLLIEN